MSNKKFENYLICESLRSFILNDFLAFALGSLCVVLIIWAFFMCLCLVENHTLETMFMKKNSGVLAIFYCFCITLSLPIFWFFPGSAYNIFLERRLIVSLTEEFLIISNFDNMVLLSVSLSECKWTRAFMYKARYPVQKQKNGVLIFAKTLALKKCIIISFNCSKYGEINVPVGITTKFYNNWEIMLSRLIPVPVGVHEVSSAPETPVSELISGEKSAVEQSNTSEPLDESTQKE